MEKNNFKKESQINPSGFKNGSLIAIIGIAIIMAISFIIRLYLFTPSIPVTLDSFEYFLYAVETSTIGSLPNYPSYNNGWPYFLSLFFSLSQLDNAISLMQLQRFLTVIFSVVTIIPIYLLCRKFFGIKLSLIGAAIFGFEPRIIQNSLFGITEPLYILLGTVSILFFLSSNKKIIFLSFGIVAMATLIRSEGLFLFFALSIMFLVRFRKEHLVIPKYIAALGIFVLSLIPMIVHRMSINGNDAVFYRVTQGLERTQSGINAGVWVGIENFVKFLGWDLIPIFIIFVPIGIFLIFKKLDYQKLTIIICAGSLSLPALYAYSVPALDTRYLFMLYPMFCVISLFTIKKIQNRIQNENLVLIAVIIGVLILSLSFLDYKVDMKHELEASLVAKELISSPKVINFFYPESRYLESVETVENWADILPLFLIEKNTSTREIIPHKVNFINIEQFDSVEKLVKNAKSEGLTHLVVDQNENRPAYFKDVYENEEKFVFLKKEYDSEKIGFDYHVKIFRIDYDEITK